ncbi:AbgT family transporter [Ferrimonas marina]|uniref:Aminobenzoyl-glutamate transport protein n=1 Tax=Ferrimonas marina TaxID=299255 RepID=A0A1M5YUS9_9GAMM|nr:AbgT family transporter [Ferrimonas marina]SHI15775.1 aminobenzoyl-glutamate transport protein [Ferrimonas marina]
MTAPKAESRWDQGWLVRLTDRLPHPFWLFLLLWASVALLSTLLAGRGGVAHPSSGEWVTIQPLLSQSGLSYTLTHLISNFVEFRPLGLVLTMMLALGVVQQTGLAEAAMIALLRRSARGWITPMVVLVGIIGNLASDAAIVLVPPIAAMMFHSVGRSPLVGVLVGFVSVFAGFTANLFISGTDLLISGISTEVAQSLDPSAVVAPTANWYFMCASVPLIVLVITLVTHKVVEPRIVPIPIESIAPKGQQPTLTPAQRQGLRSAALVAMLYLVGLVVLALWPESGLRNPQGGWLPSPALRGVVPLLMGFFLATACAYGRRSGTLAHWADLPRMMEQAIREMAPFLVLLFVVAQFIASFEWTNLAVVLAVQGAEALSSWAIAPETTLLLFILLTASLNLLVFSGSAQWSLMAPVFLPMLMLSGIEPATIQAAFRLADSSTNVISPVNPYLPMILLYLHRYQPRFSLGLLLSSALPYSLALLLCWTGLFLLWQQLQWPLGIG